MILLTGATGYIGGRLLRRLEQEGLHVRCLARRPEHLNARVGSGVEVLAGVMLTPSGRVARGRCGGLVAGGNSRTGNAPSALR